jgi:hypothetical protein
MKFDLKQILLYAILPAIVAGIFSIAPKAYEIIFETKAGLEYTLTSGPQIAADGVIQQVVSVTVINSGKRPLTVISAELSIPGATLLAASVENSSGLSIDQKRTDNKALIQLPKALPGESFLISVLAKSTVGKIEPRFVVRSDEVLGRPSEPATPNRDFKGTLQGALSAAVAVLAMALFAIRKSPSFITGGKRSAIMYVTLTCQDRNFTEVVQRTGEDVTYMQFADLLLAYGRTSLESRGRAIAGLKSLCAVKDMATESRSVVQRNLALLIAGDEKAEAVQSQETSIDIDKGVLEFRDYVDKMYGIENA